MSGIRRAAGAAAALSVCLLTPALAQGQIGRAGANGLSDSMGGAKQQARGGAGSAGHHGSPYDVPVTRELSVSETRVAERAYEDAKALLQRARAAVADDAQWQARGKALAETWFGSGDTGTRRRVLEGIDRMLAKRAYLGHGTIKTPAVAFVHPAWPSTIHLTDAFFRPDQRDRRVRTMVHELSHFQDTVDTDDVKFTSMIECREGNTFSQECIGLEAYGRRFAAKLLARKRMRNADNWAFFVDDVTRSR